MQKNVFRILFMMSVIVALCMMSVCQVQAQNAVENLGKYSAFYTYAYEKNGHQICYMYTVPIKTNRKNFLVMTNDTSDGSFGIVNFESQNGIDSVYKVVISVDGRDFSLIPFGNKAWVFDGQDAPLANALQKGKMAEVTYVPLDGNGKAVKDSFSLSGFTKAKKVLDESCPPFVPPYEESTF